MLTVGRFRLLVNRKYVGSVLTLGKTVANATLSTPARWRRARGIIFDLDGVLILSSPSHRAAFEQVFLEYGIADFDYPSYAGWRTPEVVEHVFAQRGRPIDAAQVARLAAAKSRLAREILQRQKPLAPGCEDALARLASVYPLAVASSGSRPSVDAFLKLSGSAPPVNSDCRPTLAWWSRMPSPAFRPLAPPVPVSSPSRARAPPRICG